MICLSKSSLPQRTKFKSPFHQLCPLGHCCNLWLLSSSVPDQKGPVPKKMSLVTVCHLMFARKNLRCLQGLLCLGAISNCTFLNSYMLPSKVVWSKISSLILIFSIFLAFIASRSPGQKVLFLAYFSLFNFHGSVQHALSIKYQHQEAGDEGFFERNICEVFVLCLPEGPDILSLPLLLLHLLVSLHAAF